MAASECRCALHRPRLSRRVAQSVRLLLLGACHSRLVGDGGWSLRGRSSHSHGRVWRAADRDAAALSYSLFAASSPFSRPSITVAHASIRGHKPQQRQWQQQRQQRVGQQPPPPQRGALSKHDLCSVDRPHHASRHLHRTNHRRWRMACPHPARRRRRRLRLLAAISIHIPPICSVRMLTRRSHRRHLFLFRRTAATLEHTRR